MALEVTNIPCRSWCWKEIRLPNELRVRQQLPTIYCQVFLHTRLMKIYSNSIQNAFGIFPDPAVGRFLDHSQHDDIHECKVKKIKMSSKMISKKLCHLFSCTEKSYHIHTFKKPASVPKPNLLAPFPQSRLILGAGKQMAKGKWHCSNLGKSKKLHPTKRRLRRQASAKIEKLMTRISCPKRCKQLFFKVEVFCWPKKLGPDQNVSGSTWKGA